MLKNYSSMIRDFDRMYQTEITPEQYAQLDANALSAEFKVLSAACIDYHDCLDTINRCTVIIRKYENKWQAIFTNKSKIDVAMTVEHYYICASSFEHKYYEGEMNLRNLLFFLLQNPSYHNDIFGRTYHIGSSKITSMVDCLMDMTYLEAAFNQEDNNQAYMHYVNTQLSGVPLQVIDNTVLPDMHPNSNAKPEVQLPEEPMELLKVYLRSYGEINFCRLALKKVYFDLYKINRYANSENLQKFMYLEDWEDLLDTLPECTQMVFEMFAKMCSRLRMFIRKTLREIFGAPHKSLSDMGITYMIDPKRIDVLRIRVALHKAEKMSDYSDMEEFTRNFLKKIVQMSSFRNA